MTPLFVSCVLLVSACAPNPSVDLGGGRVVSVNQVDSVVRKAGSDQRDERRRNANDQANVNATAVDTLVARPDSLLLASGDSMPLFGGPLSWTARNRAGEPILDFAPWFRVDNSRVLRISGDHLIAQAPGRGALLLTVAVRSDSLPPRILKTTRVHVVVR